MISNLLDCDVDDYGNGDNGDDGDGGGGGEGDGGDDGDDGDDGDYHHLRCVSLQVVLFNL